MWQLCRTVHVCRNFCVCACHYMLVRIADTFLNDGKLPIKVIKMYKALQKKVSFTPRIHFLNKRQMHEELNTDCGQRLPEPLSSLYPFKLPLGTPIFGYSASYFCCFSALFASLQIIDILFEQRFFVNNWQYRPVNDQKYNKYVVLCMPARISVYVFFSICLFELSILLRGQRMDICLCEFVIFT